MPRTETLRVIPLCAIVMATLSSLQVLVASEDEAVTPSRVTAVTVHLTDRVPVSVDDRIEVDIDRDETTAALPADPKGPGILRWGLAVPAAGRSEVALRHRIRAPAGMLPVEP